MALGFELNCEFAIGLLAGLELIYKYVNSRGVWITCPAVPKASAGQFLFFTRTMWRIEMSIQICELTLGRQEGLRLRSKVTRVAL